MHVHSYVAVGTRVVLQELHALYHSNVSLLLVYNLLSIVWQESELLNLAKGVNVEKAALTSVRQELEEARQLVEQRQSQLDAMQGNIQPWLIMYHHI